MPLVDDPNYIYFYINGELASIFLQTFIECVDNNITSLISGKCQHLHTVNCI